MHKIRVLHIVNSFNVGGMENGVVNVINHSDSAKITHGLCALRGIGQAGERIIQKTTKFYSLSDENSTANRTIFWNIYKVIKTFNPDIIHVRHWGPLWDTVISHLLSFRQSVLVFSYHGKTYHEYCNQGGLTSFKRKFLLKFIDRIVTLNDDMSETLRREEKVSKNITILPNGVDIDRFSPTSEKKNLRQKLGLPVDHLIFGTVGRLSKIKDMETLIKACVLMKKQKKDFVLIIVGDGSEEKYLSRCIDDNNVEDVVLMVGGKQNVDEYFKCFDVYLQSSLYEGFSNTILEAISSGLPAIVTDVGGNSLLVQDEYNGYLFPPGDHVSLAQSMVKLSGNWTIIDRFSLNSRKMAKNKWSISSMVAGYENFYLNCQGK